MRRFLDPQPLGADHRINGFEQERVVGYHALSVASIEHEVATDRARKGMPGHQIKDVRAVLDSAAK